LGNGEGNKVGGALIAKTEPGERWFETTKLGVVGTAIADAGL